MQTITIYMMVPDNLTAKPTRTPVKVKVADPKEKVERSDYGRRHQSEWTLRFSTQLPKHIHSFLLGRKLSASFGRSEDFTHLKKTVSGESLSRVTQRLNRLYDCYEHLYNLHNEARNKRIWLNFEFDPLRTVKSSFNGAQIGSAIKTKFSYVVAYISKSGAIWDQDGQRIHVTEKHIYAGVNVEWSEEREQMVDRLAKQLDNVNSNLVKFLMNLDEDNFAAVLTAGPNNLLKSPDDV